MERIDLSHPLNPPFRPSLNPTLTPPARSSTLPLITPSLTKDVRAGIKEYPYSAMGPAGGSGGSSPIKPPETIQALGGRITVVEEGEDELPAPGDLMWANTSLNNQADGGEEEAEAEEEEEETDNDDDILDVSNTQWDAVLRSKASSSVHRSSSRVNLTSDPITEEVEVEVSELERDKKRFEEEDQYWAEVERERGDPRREQLATLSAKPKRASSRAPAASLSSPVPASAPARARASSSSDSASPITWSPTPPRFGASSRTSLHQSSSPGPSNCKSGDNDVTTLGDLFNTPPRAIPSRNPLRQIALSDDEEETVDLTKRSVDKGKKKASPTVLDDDEEEEQEFPEDLAYLEAQEDDEWGDDEWNETDLALLDAPPLPKPRPSGSSGSRKKRRPTPYIVDSDDDDPLPLRKTSGRALTSRSNLPLPLPTAAGLGDELPNVGGVHFSALSASLGLAHPMMFITDLPTDVQNFYRNHGKGTRGGAVDVDFDGAKSGAAEKGKRKRLEVIEAPTDDERGDEDFGGPQKPAPGRATRGRGGAAAGRGGKKWPGAWRGRGGFKARGRGRGRGRAKKT